MRFGGIAALLALGTTGCTLETFIFPIIDDEVRISERPAELGPYTVLERRILLDDLGDGDAGGVTIFAPVETTTPRPAMVWVLGVNNRAHFHQEMHEYLASWGFVEFVPDTRDISFLDTEYHARNRDNALNVYRLASSGELGVSIDPQRMVFGGYSVGGTIAGFAAADKTTAKALLMWAPAPALIWQGVDPQAVLPLVTQPSLFLLAELDDVAADWPEDMQRLMTQSPQTIEIIPDGVHLFFQQPNYVDDRNPETTLTRIEQLSIAFETTRVYLESRLGSAVE